MFSLLLKGTHIIFLFAFTAAGVVQCGGRKLIFFIKYIKSSPIDVRIHMEHYINTFHKTISHTL